jgi:hypothetical protein
MHGTGKWVAGKLSGEVRLPAGEDCSGDALAGFDRYLVQLAEPAAIDGDAQFIAGWVVEPNGTGVCFQRGKSLIEYDGQCLIEVLGGAQRGGNGVHCLQFC